MMIMGTWVLFIFLSLWSKTVVSKVETGIALRKSESEVESSVINTIRAYCKENNFTGRNCSGLFFSELMKTVYKNLTNTHSIHKSNLLSTHPVKAWLYSIGGATLILVLSMFGALLLGLTKSTFVNYIIMTIQAFAVGVLSGNALIHLIPDGLGLDETPWYNYTWKSFVSAITVVVFCASDAIIRLYGSWVGQKKLPTYTHMDSCGNAPQDHVGHDHNHNDDNNYNNVSNGTSPKDLQNVESNTNVGSTDQQYYHRVNCFGTKVESQGIMIIIGDMLHNFIDGLAIGVSFATSTYKGWSTIISVVAEEVPHEIGDMTILVNSGFSLCKAMFWNFVSCLTCHLGVIIALSLGDLDNNAKDYIEMVCGGAFLYISFLGVYPHVMELCVKLANNNLRKYQLNLLIVYTMIIGGQAFMGGVSYLE